MFDGADRLEARMSSQKSRSRLAGGFAIIANTSRFKSFESCQHSSSSKVRAPMRSGLAGIVPVLAMSLRAAKCVADLQGGDGNKVNRGVARTA
jgi:hypothetical protein